MEKDFDQRIVREYLKYGSVNEVFNRNGWDLPISVAGFHRLLDRWGVVKAAGPNNKIGEAVEFLERLTLEKVPLERLYRKLPPSFRTSAMTLHRVLAYVKEGVIRREATALVITSRDNPKTVLMGKDVASPKIKYGQIYGAHSLPMTFSKKNERPVIAVKRVLQQEVFSKQTVKRAFPEEVIPKNLGPFVLFELADICVKVYHLELPGKFGLRDFESGKLIDYKYWDLEEVVDKKLFRTGVVEIVRFYGRYLKRGAIDKPVVEVAEVNRDLAFEEA